MKFIRAILQSRITAWVFSATIFGLMLVEVVMEPSWLAVKALVFIVSIWFLGAWSFERKEKEE